MLYITQRKQIVEVLDATLLNNTLTLPMFVKIKIMNIRKLKPKCESHGLSRDLRTTSCSSIFSKFQLLKQPTNNTVMSRYVQLQHISHTGVKYIIKCITQLYYYGCLLCTSEYVIDRIHGNKIHGNRTYKSEEDSSKIHLLFYLSSFSLILNSLSLFFNSFAPPRGISTVAS
jgi:hypothetical protein